ncbi:hypothetical protein [Methanoculleus horonobensis]|jgi:hypothetical protein|uniref:hypothetical protein n=1 Tax=Methanoculleus horonobensis TaxID=528314 RepID=UPI00082A86C0|nr:hypothetical protein [Methanoculleus horonobensis]MDD3071489.1 hypothetical protein [Methanoculleus horonobensis]MDD4252314.1 hypothetical protein [Methanoculleus horonobensis]
MTEPGPDKYDRELGAIFGVLLVIIWIALLFLIGQALFPRQVFTQNPFRAWFTLGLIPFVAYAGNYLLYTRKLGGIETVRSVIWLKSNFLGFLLWFAVLGVLYLAGYAIPYQTNGVGGLLTILVLYLAWDWSVMRRKPRVDAEQG